MQRRKRWLKAQRSHLFSGSAAWALHILATITIGCGGKHPRTVYVVDNGFDSLAGRSQLKNERHPQIFSDTLSSVANFASNSITSRGYSSACTQAY
jgi:hypothetical protein